MDADADAFRFRTSTGGEMRGPAFSVPFKVLASVVVFGTLALLLRQWQQGRLGSSMDAAWLLAAAALVWTWWTMLRSTTGIDAGHVQQSWLWDKRADLTDIAAARLIRVPGLDWLVAPRLYVRSLAGRVGVFYCADPRVVAEFDRLIAELRAFHAAR